MPRYPHRPTQMPLTARWNVRQAGLWSVVEICCSTTIDYDRLTGVLLLPNIVLSHVVDQRKTVFWKKTLNCEVIYNIATGSRCSIGMILSKYRVPYVNMKVHNIKSYIYMWKYFVNSACDSGKIHFW